MQRKRVGLIGFGFIAGFIYNEITTRPELGLDIAFVWNRSPERMKDVPSDLILEDLSDFASTSPDLVVEMSHPDISRNYAKAILQKTNYMMLSVTAMADPQLEAELKETAEANGTTLFIPHGAMVGVDNLNEARDNWADVTITFKKPPANVDLSESGTDAAEAGSAQVIYDGSVRGAAAKFPRNVNSMATCALASLGFDQTRGIMIIDPNATAMSAEVVANGKDGSLLEIRKAEPAVGVSSPGMLTSQLGSIQRAVAGANTGLVFV